MKTVGQRLFNGSLYLVVFGCVSWFFAILIYTKSNDCLKGLVRFEGTFMRNIIVVGCGRVGSRLAMMFSETGDNVCVVDSKAESFKNLGRGFNGTTMQGIGFDEEVLIKCGIEECDVVAAVTNLDNTNLMVAEVARRLYEVPRVIARLDNANHERAYMQLGFDYVCGTSLIAEAVFSKIVAGHGSHVDTFGEFEILRFSLDLNSKKKKTIRVSELERDHDVRIVAFERGDGSASSIPTSESVLYHGDTVMACIRHELIATYDCFIQD